MGKCLPAWKSRMAHVAIQIYKIFLAMNKIFDLLLQAFFQKTADIDTC